MRACGLCRSTGYPGHVNTKVPRTVPGLPSELSQDGRGFNAETCGRLGTAIPLPKRVSPPVTEVGLSGLTTLLISRENELELRGSPRGGPSEGRAGNQRDQCESSDKRLHHISPCLWAIVRDLPATEKTDASCLVFPKEIGSAPRSDQLYLWIYWMSQRSKAFILWFRHLAPSPEL